MSKPLIKNILVAVDGSKASIQAAKYGIILAKQYKFSLKAVFVVDTATLKFLTSSRFFVTEESQSYELNLREDGKKYLDYVSNLAKTKGLKIETELLEGTVWSEIVKSADAFHADLILLGGKQVKQNNYAEGLTKRISTKVTVRNEVSDLAHCPVVQVHKPEVEDLFKLE